MIRTSVAREYMRCRTWGHAWEEYVPQGTRPKWGELFTLRCVRCATERHDVINNLGQLGQRTYNYPEGYQLAAEDVPSRDQFRRELAAMLKESTRKRQRGAA